MPEPKDEELGPGPVEPPHPVEGAGEPSGQIRSNPTRAPSPPPAGLPQEPAGMQTPAEEEKKDEPLKGGDV